jgi:pimeloyl-ACP methyl ester carboxylesterase
MRRFLAVFLTLAAILCAAWLVLRRPDIPYETLETAFITPQSQFVSLGSDEPFIHYTDSGPKDAPVIVLLHGFAASTATWEAWRTELAKDWRVIAVDLPGHGLTRATPGDPSPEAFADILERFVERIGLERFVLGGSSMGGYVSWTYATLQPQRLNGLILLGASGWPPEGDFKRPLAFRLISNPAAQAVLADLDLTMVIENALKDSFTDDNRVTPEMVERYSLLSRAPGHRDWLMRLTTRKPKDREAVRATLAGLSVPTLVIHGADDGVVPSLLGQRLAETIPGARWHLLDGVGHLPQEEAATVSLALVRDFLGQLP